MSMSALTAGTAVRKFFGTTPPPADGGYASIKEFRKDWMELSKESKQELGEMAAAALGVELKSSSSKAKVAATG